MSSPSRSLKTSVPNATRHEHRTAKIVELVGSSSVSFDEAIRNALEDASASTRGISGVHIENMSIKCNDGHPLEYKVSMKVSFGVERTSPP